MRYRTERDKKKEGKGIFQRFLRGLHESEKEKVIIRKTKDKEDSESGLEMFEKVKSQG